MSNAKRLTTLIVLCFFLIGCNVKIHKDFVFESIVIEMDWFNVNAKLRGAPSIINPNLSVSGSPYDFLIWFTAKGRNDVIGCKFILEDLLLINNETNEILLDVQNSSAIFIKRSDGIFAANLAFEKLDLIYNDYRVSFKLSNSGHCPLTDKKQIIEFHLNKAYKEKEITFWDALMGI